MKRPTASRQFIHFREWRKYHTRHSIFSASASFPFIDEAAKNRVSRKSICASLGGSYKWWFPPSVGRCDSARGRAYPAGTAFRQPREARKVAAKKTDAARSGGFPRRKYLSGGDTAYKTFRAGKVRFPAGNRGFNLLIFWSKGLTDWLESP